MVYISFENVRYMAFLEVLGVKKELERGQNHLFENGRSPVLEKLWNKIVSDIKYDSLSIYDPYINNRGPELIFNI